MQPPTPNYDSEESDADEEYLGEPPGYQDESGGVIYRGTTSDPIFGLLLAGAISIGLTPLVGSDAADLRYTLAWGLLAAFGVMSWLLGSNARIEQETPENLAWGVIFALILGVPVLAFATGILAEAADMLFPDMRIGAVLAYLVFVMPLGETLFFRGLLQQGRTFWSAGLMATAWGLVLFFPLMNRGPFPLIVGTVLLMANLMYSYVRERNGLAAAWLCQITVNIIILFLPFSGIL